MGLEYAQQYAKGSALALVCLCTKATSYSDK